MVKVFCFSIGTTVSFILHPWQFVFVILAGWLNREQQQVIDYLRTENQVLKETHGKKLIFLNDDQRRHLAVKGKILGSKMLDKAWVRADLVILAQAIRSENTVVLLIGGSGTGQTKNGT